MSRPLIGGPRVPRETLYGRPTRVYLAGYRIHHGPVGILLALMGLVLWWSDRKDFPWTP